jgi:hypothetical protein
MDDKISPENLPKWIGFWQQPPTTALLRRSDDIYRNLYEGAKLSSSMQMMEPAAGTAVAVLAENEKMRIRLFWSAGIAPSISKENSAEIIRPRINKFSLYTAIVSVPRWSCFWPMYNWTADSVINFAVMCRGPLTPDGVRILRRWRKGRRCHQRLGWSISDGSSWRKCVERDWDWHHW